MDGVPFFIEAHELAGFQRCLRLSAASCPSEWVTSQLFATSLP
jgi:hypothetical protein